MAKPTHFADYACVVTDIDRNAYGRRIVPMKVLMLGMPRTGTESTCKALRLLGISECYHGWQPLFGNPRDNEMWLDAIGRKYDGKGKPYGKAEFDKLLGHCQGVSDMPAILFADELIKAYPNALVILTYRDFESWYRSALDTCERRFSHPLTKALIPVTYFLRMSSRWTPPTFKRSWELLFDGDFQANARKCYNRHYQHVKSIVPAKNLLEYDVKQGWAPLCNFLQVDRPDEPFPRGNDAVTLNLRFEAALLLTLQAVFRRLLFVLLLLCAVVVGCLLACSSIR